MGGEESDHRIGGLTPFTAVVAMTQDTEATFPLPEKTKKFTMRPRSKKAFLANIAMASGGIAAGDYLSLGATESFSDGGLWTLKGAALFFQNGETTDIMEITYWM